MRLDLNRIEGVRSGYVLEKSLPIGRTGRAFEVSAEIDEFIPGACGWRPMYLYFRVNDTDRVPVIYLYRPSNDPTPPLHFSCAREAIKAYNSAAYCLWFPRAVRRSEKWNPASPVIEMHFHDLDAK